MNLSNTEDHNFQGLLDVMGVQQVLQRSRASVYRYANTDENDLNPPYNPKRLNPELRFNSTDPLLFHPNEVARFAKEVLRIQQVTIAIQETPPDQTQQLLNEILTELRAIHTTLQSLATRD